MADTINSTGSEFVFSDWLELFQKYRDDMEKELETVRLHKKEVQNIRQEIYDRYENGYFPPGIRIRVPACRSGAGTGNPPQGRRSTPVITRIPACGRRWG